MTRVVAQRFELVRALGEGGMGVVYEAIDRDLQSRVALKAIRHPGPLALARFKREFRALQDIHHPNLVTLGELVAERDEWFISMELIEGSDFLDFVTSEEKGADSRRGLASTMHVLERSGDVEPLSVSGARRALGAFNEGRLRSAVTQVANGLAALHAAGKVHRDIKPSNVLVTPAGRVVILDFGLVSDVEGVDRSTGKGLVGTPAYMSPEQASAGAIGAPSDLYSVGVMLFEALTGRLPFEGAPLQILTAKQLNEAAAPGTLNAAAPPDLDELCSKLLAFDPSRRPSAVDILRAASERPSAETTSLSHVALSGSSGTQHAVFVGRSAELAALGSALDRSLRGGCVTVLVHGESGIGKSCLVRHFTEGLSHRGIVVFGGRCFERESAPFKAFDGVVEAMVRYLMKLSNDVVAQLLPTYLEALTQVFPGLRRVPLVTKLERFTTHALDPRELRRRAFLGLKEMIGRAAERETIVIQIDDMQWADADSIALLSHLLRPPDPPPVLILMTSRAPELAAGDHEPAFRDVISMPVPRLSPEDGASLALKLLERGGAGPGASAAQITAEAGGHPLFIDELVRHASLAEGGAAATAPRLDDALWSRISHLEPLSRRLLEAVCVAGAPVRPRALASASGATMNELAHATATLRIQHFVRSGGSQGADLLEPYHDRVRETVVARLGDEERRTLHERLAIALEMIGAADPEAVANHWYGAGDRQRAGQLMVRAGEAAARALAFDRAATLFRTALEQGGGGAIEERELRAKLGDALANAGRGVLAAAEYRLAAARAPERTALELRRLAAEQLLRSGHFDRGLDATGEILVSVGMSLPRSPIVALFLVLLLRAIVRLRGERYTRRDSSQIVDGDLKRLDVCWSVAFALSHVDTIFGYVFGLRYFLLALRSGEPVRVAKAIAILTSYTGVAGAAVRSRTRYLMRLGRTLAEESASGEALGWWYATAASTHYLAGEFVESLALSEEGEQVFRNRCSGSAWEVLTMHIYTLQSLAQLGRLEDLCKRTPAYLQEALDLGDLYGAVNMRIGYANLRWLVDDDPEGARRDVREAMASWSKRGFHLEHYYGLLAETNADLYSGSVRAALSRVDASWRRLQRSLLLRVQAVRIQALAMRARALLAVAVEERAPRERRYLLWRARSVHGSILQARAAWARPLADLVLASVFHLEGADAQSIEALGRAIAGFAEVHMALHENVARRARGMVLGGEEGRALVGSGEEWLAARAVRAPARFASMIAPGFDGSPR